MSVWTQYTKATATIGVDFRVIGAIELAPSCLDNIRIDWLISDDEPVLNEWSTAHAGFGRPPEPETHAGDK
jgi:hypothetical protein